MIQRTKLGFVFRRVVISFVSCSLYSAPTVRNMPFLGPVRAPNGDDCFCIVTPMETMEVTVLKKENIGNSGEIGKIADI